MLFRDGATQIFEILSHVFRANRVELERAGVAPLKKLSNRSLVRCFCVKISDLSSKKLFGRENCRRTRAFNKRRELPRPTPKLELARPPMFLGVFVLGQFARRLRSEDHGRLAHTSSLPGHRRMASTGMANALSPRT